MANTCFPWDTAGSPTQTVMNSGVSEQEPMSAWVQPLGRWTEASAPHEVSEHQGRQEATRALKTLEHLPLPQEGDSR